MSKKRKETQREDNLMRDGKANVFVLNGDKPVSLLCNEVVAVPKESNLRPLFNNDNGA